MTHRDDIDALVALAHRLAIPAERAAALADVDAWLDRQDVSPEVREAARRYLDGFPPGAANAFWQSWGTEKGEQS